VNHTPEPWEARRADHWGSYRIRPAEIWLGASSSMAEDEQAANAARIVKCVNACAGIENPAEAIRAAREALEGALSLTEESARFYGSQLERSMRQALAQLKGGAA